ncbi:MAG: hypothetical protein BYD32DRAFT_424289 [Podila humilis]|nr:MAG: hypothetical protein BYD32DRAFT_424289 [Podila humilis]
MTRNHFFICSFIFFHFFLSSTPSTLVYSQTPFTPLTTWGSASVYIEGKAFYVQAGRINGAQGWSPQVFSINLNTSWSIASPAYTHMPDGLPDSHVFPNALMQDGKTWFIFKNNSLFTYDLTTGILKQGAVIVTYTGTHALSAARDPVTGEMVIPGGFYSSPLQNTTMRFSPERLTSTSVPAFSEIDNRRYVAMAASESAKAVFSFGGLVGGNVMSSFVRLDSSAASWRSAATTSDPSPRALTCLVSAYGGSKLVVFGGETQLDEVLGDIYIFDVALSTWTRGADGGPNRARAGHVCAVSGDMFLSWGGYRNVSTRAAIPETLSVYNIKTNNWVDRYTPSLGTGSESGGNGNNTGGGSGSGIGPETGHDSALPPDSNTKSSSGSSMNVAIIAGGAGAVVVLLGAMFLIFHRRRATQRHTRAPNSEGTENLEEETMYPPPRSILERNSMTVPLAHPAPYIRTIGQYPPPIPRHSKEDAQLRNPHLVQAFGVEEPEQLHKIEYEQDQNFHQEDHEHALDLRIERQQAELQMLKEQRQALRSSSPVPEYYLARPGSIPGSIGQMAASRRPQEYRYRAHSQQSDSLPKNHKYVMERQHTRNPQQRE